jgi:hypothetical protein
VKWVRHGAPHIFGLFVAVEYPASAYIGARHMSDRGVWSLHVLFEIGMVASSLAFAVVRRWGRGYALRGSN